MRGLIRFSLQNRAILILASLLLVIAGMLTARSLRQELLPNIDFPVVTVITPYPLASPEVVEAQVTRPIENVLSNLEGLDSYTSTSSDNVSVVVLQFDFGTDLRRAEADAQTAVNRVRASLPSGVGESTASAIRFGDAPVLQLAVTGDNLDLANVRRRADETLVPQLERVAGVSRIDLTGASDPEVRVTLKQDKLREYNLTFDGVAQALQAAPLSLPIGQVRQGSVNVPIRSEAAARSVADLAGIVVGAVPDPNAVARLEREARSQAETAARAQAEVAQAQQQALSQTARLAQQALQTAAQASARADAALQAAQQASRQAAAASGTQGQNRLPGVPEASASGASSSASSAASGAPDLAASGGTVGIPTAPSPNTSLPGTSGASPTIPRSPEGTTAPSIGASSFAAPFTRATSAEGGSVPLRPVLLSEVAEIGLRAQDASSLSRFDGRAALGLAVYKAQTANTLQVTEAVRGALGDAERASRLRVDVISDQGEPIRSGVEGLLKEGGFGALFAVLVVLVFLGNLRSTIVTAIAIPTSLLVGLIFLGAQGLSLNVLTLGGLTIAIGRLIDDAIVVVENIYHKLDSGLPPLRAAYEGTTEVASPITSSTVATVAVFLPLAFVGGIPGEFLRPLALAVAFSILSSLLVALTIVPLFSSLFLKASKKPPRPSLLERLYGPVIRWVTGHRALTLVSALALLIMSTLAVRGLPTTFIGGGQPNSVQVRASLPAGTTVETADAFARRLEGQVRGLEGVGSVLTSVGRAQGNFALAASGAGVPVNLTVLPSEGTDVEALRERVEAVTASFREQRVTVQAGDGGGFSNTLRVQVAADSLTDLQRATDLVFKRVRDLPQLENVRTNLQASKTELALEVNSRKAYEQGVLPFQATQAVQAALSGRVVTNLNIDDDDIGVRLRFPPGLYDTPRELRALEIRKIQGAETVPLSRFATIQERRVPSAITRENGRRNASVEADPATRDIGAANRALQTALADLQLPAGASWRLAGVTEQQNEAFSSLLFAIVAAVGLVYIVMVAAFQSVLTPLLLLFSIPFVAVGAFPLMKLTGTPIGLSTMFGFLLLVGIVVTNAIVLIDYVERLRERGSELSEAMIEGGKRRVRPIIMTALTTILALSPLALGVSESGAIVGQPLAITVIGGLASSTLLTLVVIPALYLTVEDLKRRLGIRTRTERQEAILAD
ncbi:efflux RND transporter permease subunit [Deinococcus yavapaiensis]|uniref:HAE1 family hydrophobic/amphiphilic exporter-1 n=1 Tax=Deinococcus yavapaiensis KR-236 TaxID=694435 RepID=A0A318SP25_9DEIO|nr:efflux RND transporter permease subunit [Deinococcus yavapaiensis]PYE56682.1 HAE1 family hydrophobic/amphiphilic exporter-1 [Deinococcus yavapaiensis KR-236]